ncbi:MAG: hypothetical protein PHG65_05395, partial [Kiritimatiellae bacterium]|nr:hypothetical protein [Kiritimatiellia bacterium]
MTAGVIIILLCFVVLVVVITRISANNGTKSSKKGKTTGTKEINLSEMLEKLDTLDEEARHLTAVRL